MKKILIFFICLFALNSCKKDVITDQCSLLRQGILNNDVNKAKQAVTAIIESLPSQDYNRGNLEKLAEKLSTGCNIGIVYKCFDCILTLPSQSEISLSVDSTRGLQKVIDISYTANNKMSFHNMHE